MNTCEIDLGEGTAGFVLGEGPVGILLIHGLTGTPINRADRNTFYAFGAEEDEKGYMSRYGFEESIRDGATLVADVLAMGSEPDDRLAALALPVLLVYGRQSPCLAAAGHLQQRLPDASLRLLDCGHYIPDEAPAELLAALRHFFTQGQAHVQT